MNKTYPEDFLEAGFTSHPPKHGGKDPQWCTHFFQKRVRGEDRETLYFINAYIHDLSGINGPCHLVEANARLYTEATGSFGIEVQVNANDVGSAQEVVDFYADTYQRLGCIPDPHN